MSGPTVGGEESGTREASVAALKREKSAIASDSCSPFTRPTEADNLFLSFAASNKYKLHKMFASRIDQAGEAKSRRFRANGSALLLRKHISMDHCSAASYVFHHIQDRSVETGDETSDMKCHAQTHASIASSAHGPGSARPGIVHAAFKSRWLHKKANRNPSPRNGNLLAAKIV